MSANNNNAIVGSVVQGLLAASTSAEETRAKKAMNLTYELRHFNVATTATEAILYWVAKVDKKVQVTSVKVIGAAALTADSTSYATLSLEYDDGAGGADTQVAVASTTPAGTGNWTAGTAVALTITASNAVIDGETADKYLIFKKAVTAGGVATPALGVFVTCNLVA